MIYSLDNLITSLEKYSIEPFRALSPTLGVILSKEATEDDRCYLRNIEKKAKQYSANISVRECASPFEAIQSIQSLRESTIINGIIIIGSFGKDADQGLADSIPSRLDIDCIAADTYGSLFTSTSPTGFRLGPCTSVACFKILEDILKTSDFSGYNVLILGRSMRVGRPLAEILCQHNATVTVAHSKSGKFILSDFRGYDIVISAVGKPKIWNDEYLFGATTKIAIDVGINVDENGKICGDIDQPNFDTDKDLIYVKSPGGVGKVTTTILFAKLFYNCALMNGEIL